MKATVFYSAELYALPTAGAIPFYYKCVTSKGNSHIIIRKNIRKSHAHIFDKCSRNTGIILK